MRSVKRYLKKQLIGLQLCLMALLLLCGGTSAFAIEQVTYYHNDIIGSPVAATDENGDVLWQESYEPYGARSENQAAAKGNRRWYTGHAEDSISGLTYMQARYYDPRIGRFMAIDPVGFGSGNPASFNRYAYANNNPYRYVDPDGFAPAGAYYGDGTPGSMWAAAGFQSMPPMDVRTLEQKDIDQARIGEVLQAVGGAGSMLRSGVKYGIKRGFGGVTKSVDDIFKAGRTPKASELKKYADGQGWKPTQTEDGPLKYVDENGIPRVTIKQGSSRAPGSGNSHVELKDATGQRIDPAGNPVTRKSPGNHTPIDYDL